MCIAERIAHDILRLQGYREPKRHPHWQSIVDIVQSHLDANLELMKRVIETDAVMESNIFRRMSKLKKIIHCLKS